MPERDGDGRARRGPLRHRPAPPAARPRRVGAATPRAASWSRPNRPATASSASRRWSRPTTASRWPRSTSTSGARARSWGSGRRAGTTSGSRRCGAIGPGSSGPRGGVRARRRSRRPRGAPRARRGGHAPPGRGRRGLPAQGLKRLVELAGFAELDVPAVEAVLAPVGGDDRLAVGVVHHGEQVADAAAVDAGDGLGDVHRRA